MQIPPYYQSHSPSGEQTSPSSCPSDQTGAPPPTFSSWSETTHHHNEHTECKVSTPLTTSLVVEIKAFSELHPLLEQLSKEKGGRCPISQIPAFQRINHLSTPALGPTWVSKWWLESTSCSRELNSNFGVRRNELSELKCSQLHLFCRVPTDSWGQNKHPCALLF